MRAKRAILTARSMGVQNAQSGGGAHSPHSIPDFGRDHHRDPRYQLLSRPDNHDEASACLYRDGACPS